VRNRQDPAIPPPAPIHPREVANLAYFVASYREFGRRYSVAFQSLVKAEK
jgi:hypothetical protein